MLSSKCLSFLILLGAIAIILLPQKSDAACVCNEKGTDYCSGCSGRRIVRPKHKATEPNPDINLSPIGDKCYCTKKMIEPAVLPKVMERKKPCDCGHKSSSCSCGKTCNCGKPNGSCGCQKSSSSHEASIFSSVGTSSTYAAPQVHYKSDERDHSMAADPISISMAIQAGKAFDVPEAMLAYGFDQKPIESLPKVYISSVKEENLYALKNDVITLKKNQPARKKVEEEYTEMEEEESLHEDDGGQDDNEKPRLTYKQLGYVTEQYKNPKFQEVQSSYDFPSSSDCEPSVVKEKVSVDCGYRPGRISIMRKSTRQGSFQ